MAPSLPWGRRLSTFQGTVLPPYLNPGDSPPHGREPALREELQTEHATNWGPRNTYWAPLGPAHLLAKINVAPGCITFST